MDVGGDVPARANAVVLALVAALYAKRSADSTDQAVALARDEVEMTRAEHAEFLRQLQARARFQLTPRPVYPEPDEDGVIRETVSMVRVLVEFGLKNVGERAAGETVMNVVAPRHIQNLRWSGPRGEDAPDTKTSAETSEELIDDDGEAHPGQYLANTIPRVTRRSHYVTFFVLDVRVPITGVASVPLRLTADADELPDDEPQASERLMIRVGFPEPA